MRRFLALPAVLLLVVAACDLQTPAPTEPALSPGGMNAAVTEGSPGTYLVLAQRNGLDEAVALAERLGGSVSYQHAGVGLAVISGLTPAGAAELSADRSVDEIVADEVFALEEPTMVGAEAVTPASPGDPTTASRFPQQWNMHAIHAAEAWAGGRTGSEDVTIAILDTGIDYMYPDLQGRVDLSRSVSFLQADDDLVAAVFPGAHPIADLHYHGTHVASTISSNAYVAAGVTSQTTLIGVKVCSVYGGCPGSAIFPGILYATDAGADVINMSLGGAFTRAGARGYGAFIKSIMDYADKAGVTVVVAAGNGSADLDRNYYPNQDDIQTHYPSLYATYCDSPTTICVSGTGPTAGGTYSIGPWTDPDASAVYTNYGRSAIDVAAPGGNYGASVIGACSGFSLVISVCRTGTYVVGLGGTSMASPHVAGLAALLVEDLGRNPSKIKVQLQQSADDLGEPGTDPFYGKGRINMARALGF